jgi:hypothetical protein
MSAGISLYSAHFAALQYENATAVRRDSRDAAQRQTELQRSRKAAEESARAAADLAATTRQSVALAGRNAELSRRIVLDQVASLDLQQRPILVFTRIERTESPVANDRVTLSLANAGRSPAYDISSKTAYVFGKNSFVSFSRAGVSWAYNTDLVGRTIMAGEPMVWPEMVTVVAEWLKAPVTAGVFQIVLLPGKPSNWRVEMTIQYRDLAGHQAPGAKSPYTLSWCSDLYQEEGGPIKMMLMCTEDHQSRNIPGLSTKR